LPYELPLEERLAIFADACEDLEIEKTRAFFLVVEKEAKLCLRKVVMTHDMIISKA